MIDNQRVRRSHHAALAQPVASMASAMLSAPPETATANTGLGSNGPKRCIAAAKAAVSSWSMLNDPR